MAENILTNFQYSRQQQRYSTLSGTTPTIPVLTGETMTGFTESDNMVLGNFIDTDLLNGEFFINTVDDRVFIRSDDRILEFITTGGTLDNVSTTGGTWNSSANTLTYTKSNGISYSVDIDAFSGLTINGGLVYVDGNQSVNKVLTSDASGNASWQNPSVVGNLTYFFKNAASDIGGYLQALDVPQTGPVQTISNTGVVNNQLLATFATLSGGTGVSFYPSGIVGLHMHAANTNSGKATELYFNIYLRTTGGTETLLGTSSFSDTLTNTSTEKTTDLAISATTGNTTDRIVVKVYANVTGPGTAPDINLYIEDATLSRVSLPSIAVNSNNFVPYSGAINNLNLGTYSINAGTILSGGTNISTLFAQPLTNGNGTTVNGTAIDLGGALNKTTSISGASQTLSLGLSTSSLLNFNVQSILGSKTYSSGPSVNQIIDTPGGRVHTSSTPSASGIFEVHPGSTYANVSGATDTGKFAVRIEGGSVDKSAELTVNNSGLLTSVSAQTTTINYGSSKLVIGTGTTIFTDSSATPKGIQYAADYSANYTSKSLITKGDLDAATSGASTDYFLTGHTWAANTLTSKLNNNNTVSVVIDTFTNLNTTGNMTVGGNLTVTGNTTTTGNNTTNGNNITNGAILSGSTNLLNIFALSGSSAGLTGGTTDYLGRWTSSTTLGIGATRDNGTSVGIGQAPATGYGLVIADNYSNGIALSVNQSTTGAAYGITASAGAVTTGSTTYAVGVDGTTQNGGASTVLVGIQGGGATSVGTQDGGCTAIGVKGTTGLNFNNTGDTTTFYGFAEYVHANNNYGIILDIANTGSGESYIGRFNDNRTAGAGKFLKCIDANGTAEWATVTGGTNIYNSNGTIGSGRTATLTDSLSFVGGTVYIKGGGSTSSTNAFLVQNSSSSDLFRVLDNGYVGIGSASPTTWLEVNKDTGAYSSSALPSNHVLLRNPTQQGNGFAGITFQAAPQGGYFEGVGYIGLVAGNNASYGDMFFGTRDAAGFNEKVRLLSTGEFGIGTTAPTGRLTIKGASSASTTTSLLVQNSASSTLFKTEDDGGVFIGIAPASSTTANVLARNTSTGEIETRTLNSIKPTLNKTFTLEAPTASEDFTIFRTDVAITIVEVISVSVGTTPSTTYKLKHDTDRDVTGTDVTTSAATTSKTTGDIATASDYTIPANSWIWLETTAASGTSVKLTIDIRYTED